MASASKTSLTLIAQVERLRRALDCQGAAPAPREGTIVSAGAPPLDRCLPQGGFRQGSLVEYLGRGISLALAAARAACQQRALIVVDRRQQLYPAGWPFDLSRIVLVRPSSDADELWACDQALRCPGVGAVIAQPAKLDSRNFRRLQLAAEEGRTLGLLVRPRKLQGKPSWADVQWLVKPQGSSGRWRLCVELLRCRGGKVGGSVVVELDEDYSWREVNGENSLPLPAELATPTVARCRSRA